MVITEDGGLLIRDRPIKANPRAQYPSTVLGKLETEGLEGAEPTSWVALQSGAQRQQQCGLQVWGSLLLAAKVAQSWALGFSSPFYSWGVCPKGWLLGGLRP